MYGRRAAEERCQLEEDIIVVHLRPLRYNLLRCDALRYNVVWHGERRYDVLWYDKLRYLVLCLHELWYVALRPNHARPCLRLRLRFRLHCCTHRFEHRYAMPQIPQCRVVVLDVLLDLRE